MNLIQFEGECIGAKELGDFLNLLVGDGNFKTALPQDVTADEFAENILGFEEVEDGEEEQEEYE